MFTTLNTTYKDRQGLKEKLHLTPTRKFKSQQFEYRNIKFYTTRLLTMSHINESRLMRFKENCSLPVIEENDDIVIKYRYVVTINTIINHLADTHLTCALVDPKGQLVFLLPLLVSHCRKVNVYTCDTERYQSENDRICSLIGSSAIITDKFTSLKSFNAVFSDIPLPFCDNPYLFGRYSFFAGAPPILPEDIKVLGLSDDEIYPALAGLYYICGLKKLGHLRCSTLQKTSPQT